MTLLSLLWLSLWGAATLILIPALIVGVTTRLRISCPTILDLTLFTLIGLGVWLFLVIGLVGLFTGIALGLLSLSRGG